LGFAYTLQTITARSDLAVFSRSDPGLQGVTALPSDLEHVLIHGPFALTKMRIGAEQGIGSPEEVLEVEMNFATPQPRADDPTGTQPAYSYPPYTSSINRAPSLPLIYLPHTLSERTGPVFGHSLIAPTDHDLTAQHASAPLGERMLVHGRVRDEDGHPVRGALVEIWQANASGRYFHKKDQHDAPLDPNFTGAGRAMTNDDGYYEFRTIKPGAYPWSNHYNAWRPAHIHFSLFGTGILSRLVTQMYFPGDPLHALDPIFQSIEDENARRRLISRFDITRTEPQFALAYEFNIVLRGREDTPFEEPNK
jgi:protocatechuate 3,4-dioxygenase beta subunit